MAYESARPSRPSGSSRVTSAFPVSLCGPRSTGWFAMASWRGGMAAAPMSPSRRLPSPCYELLEERYGIVIASGNQTIEPTVTTEEESQLLAVPLHTPAFLFERTTVAESDRIVEFVRSIYRGDRYRLITELHPGRGRNGRFKSESRR